MLVQVLDPAKNSIGFQLDVVFRFEKISEMHVVCLPILDPAENSISFQLGCACKHLDAGADACKHLDAGADPAWGQGGSSPPFPHELHGN